MEKVYCLAKASGTEADLVKGRENQSLKASKSTYRYPTIKKKRLILKLTLNGHIFVNSATSCVFPPKGCDKKTTCLSCSTEQIQTPVVDKAVPCEAANAAGRNERWSHAQPRQKEQKGHTVKQTTWHNKSNIPNSGRVWFNRYRRGVRYQGLAGGKLL